ncbi:MFS transporter [Bifidobacterium sp. SO4]|uniref:MFS transporter n=1 Tax=Bifidobacterium sp. SO4 TaxID=2809030 RepID=UPI001BDD9F7E|nr:MFS transporter [Bifidobacterium sp. SO4]MBT1170835.1 MFS transporter [Bifidobacterium sp. SO4]
MKKSLLTLSFGAFALGAAEFVMMGVLPRTASELGVDIPTAGHFISSYAIGVCFGTLMLIFGRRIAPKQLLVGFTALIAAGNLLAAFSSSYAMLIAARFISGLPHGAFFGTASVVAKRLAKPGHEAVAVSIVLTGQTIANMLGVSAGTLLGELLTWRLAFATLGLWATITLFLISLWLPNLAPIKDAGLRGQFRFLVTPRPWLILGAVLLGSSGVFCWWSYVSPWLTQVGGFPSSITPALMALAGFGMVVGGIAGGKLADLWHPGIASSLGQGMICITLLLIALDPGSMPTTALLTFLCACGMFFVNSPQQLVMVEIGEGGGEMVAAALVQIGFNFGNSIGAAVGGGVLDTFGSNYHLTALAGIPFSLVAATLLFIFHMSYERSDRTVTGHVC